jgi:hypothetical protein
MFAIVTRCLFNIVKQRVREEKNPKRVALIMHDDDDDDLEMLCANIRVRKKRKRKKKIPVAMARNN